MGLKFYRQPVGQMLEEHHYDMREQFALKFMHMIHNNQLLPENVIWTDECMLSVGPHINRQNDGRWLKRGEQLDEEWGIQTSQHYETAHCFVALHSNIGVIGPYFVEEFSVNQRKTLDSDSYIKMLTEIIVPELREKLGDSFNTSWYMQDGASCHTSAKTISYLKSVFGSRIISQNTDKLIWPPHSPDLNPLDYWFWATIRELIFHHNPKNKAQLKIIADQVCKRITATQVSKAIGDFEIRIRAVKELRGAHFEPHLKALKLMWTNKPIPICGVCEKRHRCFCPKCEEKCIDSFFADRIPLGEAGFIELTEQLSQSDDTDEDDDNEIDHELDAELDPDYRF